MLGGGYGKYLGPIAVSDIALVAFNCFFSTVNHPRYIDSHIAILCLFAAIEIGMWSTLFIQRTVLLSGLTLLLVSNYYTIDWVSKAVFNHYDLGMTLLSPAGEYFSDAMVYNQQYRYIDIALNDALENVVFDCDANYYFPTLGSNTWFFDGIMGKFRYIDEITVYDEYWDCVKNKRVTRETSNTIPLRICQLPAQYPLYELAEEAPGYFFYSPCLGKDIRDELMENISGVKEEIFEYRGIRIIRVSW